MTKIFDVPEITRYITENYTDFKDDTLLDKKPVNNWPQLLGSKAADFINSICNGEQLINVYLVHGGVGRTTIEILRKCKNLSILHSDVNKEKVNVLEHLLNTSSIQWHQQVEGRIFQAMNFSLNTNEIPQSLLKLKNSSISFKRVEYNLENAPEHDNLFDIVVADFRHKDAAAELLHIASSLKKEGFLILGSIDDIRDGVQHTGTHSLHVLKRYFKNISSIAIEEFAHIFKETQNKHQYAISYFSVWQKIATDEISHEELINDEVIPSSSEVSTTEQYYEDEHILSSYETFHFGEGLLTVKNFPLRMSEVILEACKKYNCTMNAALDAGCGPGRTAIELCSAFKNVEGYDYSQGFIDLFLKYKEKRKIVNLICYQGDSHKQEEICRAKKFDMIFGCNLIDRLHTPQMWLEQSKKMLNPNGLLVISSPYTWKPEHTPIKKWIGGFSQNGEDIFTVDGLKNFLAPELILLEETKVPFVIPDADGTYQYTYSNCTIFGYIQQ